MSCELASNAGPSPWRLQRIPALEFAIYAQGRSQFASQFEEHEPALRSSLIELQTHLAYEKQLRNLHTQEARLHRRREKDLAELRQAQSERKDRDTETLEAASRLHAQAKRANKPFDPLDLGFEFSITDIETYSAGGSVPDIAYAAFRRAADSRLKMKTAA